MIGTGGRCRADVTADLREVSFASQPLRPWRDSMVVAQLPTVAGAVRGHALPPRANSVGNICGVRKPEILAVVVCTRLSRSKNERGTVAILHAGGMDLDAA